MKSYSETKKEADRNIKARRKEKERYIINMNVKDDSAFLSVYSENETPVISSDVADFIESSATPVRPGDDLVLKIKSNSIDDEEKQIYDRAIREYYFERYAKNRRELLRNYIISALFFAFGVLILLFSAFLAYKDASSIWLEVVDIAAWVFLWEAVYIAFLESRKLKLDNVKYISYMAMDIVYESIDNPNSQRTLYDEKKTF